jgi:hypothetical protein
MMNDGIVVLVHFQVIYDMFGPESFRALYTGEEIILLWNEGEDILLIFVY